MPTATPTSAPSATSTTRVITYAYDGLQRLVGADESPGTSYAYAYDDAGNRIGVWVNGTRTVTQTFNAANQVNGLTYDAVGNLTNDGSATYAYDALNRLTIRSTTPYTYNGDGALVDDGATRYTQDLASPLTQVLQTTQISTTNYLYGLDRLAAVAGSTRTWYGADALGSVRQTLDDAGTPLSVVNYDPWGTVEGGSVPTFGFTGELQDSAAGLVNLRARWYSTTRGTLTSRDPFAGVAETPYSQHPYAYALSNPVRYGDPSGRFCWDINASYDLGTTCNHVSVATQISVAIVDIVPRYSAGFVQHGIDAVTGIAAFANPETYRAAWRGVDALYYQPQQSWCFLQGAFLNGYTLAQRGTDFLTDDPVGAANSLSAEEGGGITFDVASTYFGIKGIQGAAALRAAREAEAAELAPKLPPGWNENWRWDYGTRGETPRWLDESGGEWHWHKVDKWHPEAHWDYNPWTEWNSKWQNIDINGNPMK